MITIATGSASSAQSVNAIKIVRCRDRRIWYSNKVGETLPLVKEDPNYYWAREPDGYLNIVHKNDAELIHETS